MKTLMWVFAIALLAFVLVAATPIDTGTEQRSTATTSVIIDEGLIYLEFTRTGETKDPNYWLAGTIILDRGIVGVTQIAI